MSVTASPTALCSPERLILGEHDGGVDTKPRRGRSAGHGDTLIVEFQQSELWTGEEAHFSINVFFSLRPKWEFDCARLGLDESEPPRGALGTLLDRIRPRGGDDGETWRIADQATMDDVAQQVRSQIDELIHGWILAQRGPSAELERLLAEREAADPSSAT
ncbi:MAG: hypothetical protein ABW022_15550 [Actinoplanes sp.]